MDATKKSIYIFPVLARFPFSALSWVHENAPRPVFFLSLPLTNHLLAWILLCCLLTQLRVQMVPPYGALRHRILLKGWAQHWCTMSSCSASPCASQRWHPGLFYIFINSHPCIFSIPDKRSYFYHSQPWLKETTRGRMTCFNEAKVRRYRVVWLPHHCFYL